MEEDSLGWYQFESLDGKDAPHARICGLSNPFERARRLSLSGHGGSRVGANMGAGSPAIDRLLALLGGYSLPVPENLLQIAGKTAPKNERFHTEISVFTRQSSAASYCRCQKGEARTLLLGQLTPDKTLIYIELYQLARPMPAVRCPAGGRPAWSDLGAGTAPIWP